MKAELHDCCAHLMGSLLNGVYQGVLVSVLVYLVLRCWRRANAATRHAVWYATSLLVIFLIPAHYLLDQPAVWQGKDGAITLANAVQEGNEDGGERTQLASSGFELNPAAPSAESTLDEDWSDVLLLDPAPEPITGAELRLDDFGNETGFNVAGTPELTSADHGISAAIGQGATMSEEGGGAVVADPQRPRSPGLKWLTSKWLWPISYSPRSATASGVIAGFILVWLIISVLRLLALVWRLHQLRKISDKSIPATDARLTELFRTLVIQAKVRRKVNLRITGNQRCPIVLGFVHPTILLPSDMISDLEAAEPVLRHELAHVRRYDDWANLIQHFVQAVLFFHPAVLWIGKRLSLEREIACDDYVLQEGSGRRRYALLLANVAERIQQRTPALAPGVSNSHSQLQQRISMILNTRRNSSPNLARTSLASVVSVAAVLAALSFYAAPRLVLAQSSADSNPTLRKGSAVLSAPATPGEPSPESADSAASSGAAVTLSNGPGAAAVGIDPGPKFKPDAPATDPAAPSEITPPEPPEPPSADSAPRVKVRTRVAKVGKPPKGPQPPDFADSEDGGDPSIEARLRKLEKMMKALMEQQNSKHSHSAFEFKDGGNQNWNNDQEQVAKLKEQADRQAARAAEQAQRMVDQAKRASRDMYARLEDDNQGRGEAFEKQLEGLRKARESLNREMEKLDRQIQKLEQERGRGDRGDRGDRDGDRRRSDAVRERLNADVSVTPDVTVTPDVVVTPEAGR